MQQPAKDSPFIDRFDGACTAMLRMRIMRGICYCVFIALGALLALAAADYAWELPRAVRMAGLAISMGLTLVVATVAVVRPLSSWSRPGMAQELEARFPQLGQRARTVVQFSGHAAEEVVRDGVKPELVAALESETSIQTQLLDLYQIVPRRQAFVAATLAAMPIVLLVAGLGLDWQWRLALQRALLIERPYTTLVVEPGDVLVDHGDNVTLTATLEGRVARPVSLLTRKVDDPTASWQRQKLGAERVSQRSPDGRQLVYSLTLNKLVAPLHYRFVAGDLEDGVYHIAIRKPLSLKKFEATLTPPRYTGVPPKTVKEGDLVAIEGSEIDLLLDRKSVV